MHVQAVFSKSNFKALLSNVLMRSSSNVSKWVDGLRYLTKSTLVVCRLWAIKIGEEWEVRWNVSSVESR